MIKYKIIVPAFAELSIDMQVETGKKYPPFITLNGETLYSHIIKHYQPIWYMSEIIFALSPHASIPESRDFLGPNVKNKIINQSSSIGETIFQALDNIDLNSALIVHMGDTLISGMDFDQIEDIVFVDDKRDVYRWTTLEKLQDGSINIIGDRNILSGGEALKVCVGVFVFSDGILFLKKLKESLTNSNRSIDPFFIALNEYSKLKKVKLKKPETWNDCGHVDTYYESRLKFQNIRHFNSLSYDAEKGLVTKKSVNTEQFRNQVRWFKQVPDELATFLPRIFKSSDGEEPYITMELLSTPTLSDLFINQILDLGVWSEVAEKLKLINSTLSKYRIQSKISAHICHEIYVEKTIHRINSFLNQSPVHSHIQINIDNRLFSLQDVLSSIDSYIYKSGLLKIIDLSPIHGDMCFSNIMYDMRGRHVKLIDPRGEFGTPGIYGDPRYDKAKLMHSYCGGYDLILSNSFNLDFKSDKVLHCELLFTEYHKLVASIFNRVIFDNDEDINEIQAIQPLLFLSMLPLHGDNKNKQMAMLFVGLNLYYQQLLLMNIL